MTNASGIVGNQIMNPLAITPAKEPTLSEEQFKSNPVIPQSYTDYRDKVLAESAKVTAEDVKFPNEQGLALAVDVSRSVQSIITTINDIEELARRPLNDRLKKLRSDRNAFLAEAVAEHDRLAKLRDDYAIAKRLHDKKEEKRIADEKASADKKLADARKAIEEAKTPDMKLAARLVVEEISMLKQSLATRAPENTPQGMQTRDNYDFEIIDAHKLIAKKPALFRWKAGEEAFHFDRSGLRQSLNASTPNEVTGWRPPEDAQSVVMSDYGIRVFFSVKTNVRA